MEKNKSKWLVLDVHGVLIPSSERWILAQLSKRTKQPQLLLFIRWGLNQYEAQTGKLNAKEFYERVLNQKLTPAQFNEWIMKPYATRGNIPPTVLVRLKELKKKGWKLAVLSDMNTEQALFHKRKRTFALFDKVLISSEVGHIKPFPYFFQALEKKLGVRKDRIVFVDDLWFNTFTGFLMGWNAVTLKGEQQFLSFLNELE